MKNRKLLILCNLLFFLLLNHGFSQNIQRIAPKPLESEKGSLVEPKKEERIESEKENFLKELKGIVLLENESEVVEAGISSQVNKLETKMALSHRSDLEQSLEPFWNSPLSQEKLTKLKGTLEAHFKSLESNWVRIIVPEQKLKNNVLQLIVIKSTVDNITVEGARWFDPDDITSEFRMKRGDPLNDEAMKANLDWVNRNPFRQADLCLNPGLLRGTTDLHLKVKDRFPVRFYTGYEDSGSDLTGKDRYLLGFNWGDAMALGHLMNYQFTMGNTADSFAAHSGSYLIPLPWRHELEFFGAYAKSAGRQEEFNISGQSWQASTRYKVPLPPLREVHQEISAGYDFKRSNNNLEFGGENVFQHDTDVSQFAAEYKGRLNDSWGSTEWGSKNFISPGWMTDNNSNATFRESRAFSKANYIYGQLELTRKFQLPFGVSTRHFGTYQWASGNLIWSEQFGAGGRDTVRGYEEREINGDEGYLFQNELWSPPVSLSEVLTSWGIVDPNGVKDRLQALIFWDYATSSNRIQLRGEDRERILSSTGIGVRYYINTYLTFRADYGFQLTDSGNNNRNASRLHFNLIFSY